MASVTAGYVYLVHAIGSNLYKIGLTTRTPEKRLKELNGSQSPYQLELSHYILVDDVHKVESELHKYFNSYHHYNEWFNFSERMVSDVIETMNNYNQSHRKVVNINQSYTEYMSEYLNRFLKHFAIGIGGITLIGFILTSVMEHGKSNNPKYSECVSNRGGVACDRFLKK